MTPEEEAILSWDLIELKKIRDIIINKKITMDVQEKELHRGGY